MTPDLPTWALDLRCYNYSVKRRPWEWWKHSHRYKKFMACGNKSLECMSLDDDTVLSLKGVFVDKIEKFGVVLGEETWGDLSDDRLIATIRSWRFLLKNLSNLDRVPENMSVAAPGTMRFGEPCWEIWS